MARSFLSIDDLSPQEFDLILNVADQLKADPSLRSQALAGKSVALVFEKPSTRTRISFEVGVWQMGGQPLPISSSDMQLGRGETIEDTGHVLGRYVDAIVLRTFEQERLEIIAAASGVPVINSLSDFEHPCQAMADAMTIREWLGDPAGKTITYLGDGNNVAHSLILACARMGMNVRVATPPGFEPIPLVVQRAEEIAAERGATVTTGYDPLEAATFSDALYTDVWASMGSENEADERALVFMNYQLNQKLLDAAAENAIAMHCLPAHRGQEITDVVIDGPRSAAWDQAENRLYVQKALLLLVFGLI